MLGTFSKPGLLAICGWLCATAGLPAGVVCQEADGQASFEVTCESACDRPPTADPFRIAGLLSPASSDCSDTPIGLDAPLPGSGRDDLMPIFAFQPAPLTPEPIVGGLPTGPASAVDVERPRAGPLPVHLFSVVLLI